MRSSLVTVLVLGAAVWVLAVIGAVNVATAITSTDGGNGTQPSLLARDNGDAESNGRDVAGLPRFPGAERSEYRHAVFAEDRVTELEYLTVDSLRDVRDFYVSVFADQRWGITDAVMLRNEWTYTVTSGARSATIEIERVDGITEIEIEAVEPAPARDSATDR